VMRSHAYCGEAARKSGGCREVAPAGVTD
jgi:hypothetical protein